MNKFIKLLIIGVVSFFGIYLAFKGEDLNLLLFEIKKVSLIGILLASIILLLSCFLRALRWKILIESFGNISTMQVFSATMVGYFGNGVLAFRLGELLKAYSISLNSKVHISHAFGTVILERFLDLFIVVILGLFIFPWIPIYYSNVKVIIYIFFMISIFVILLFFFKKKIKFFQFELANRILQKTKNNKFTIYLKNVFEGLVSIKNINQFRNIILYSILLWVIYFICTLIILKSCGIELSLINTIILFVLGSLSLGIPALPGSIGTYDAAVKYILIFMFGLKNQEALNYAIISHAVSYFPLTIVGFIFFIIGNTSLKNIKKLDKNENI